MDCQDKKKEGWQNFLLLQRIIHKSTLYINNSGDFFFKFLIFIKVLEKKRKWEKLTFKCNVIQGILKLLLPYRDIYGLYDVDSMKRELEELLKLAEKKEEYEMADLIHQYRIRFLNAF